MSTIPPLSDTLTELNDLCQFFADAEKGIKKGQVVDMTGIDTRVASVCKAVETAMPAQQQQYLPEMTVLIGLLGTYEQSLRSWHTDLQKKQEETQTVGEADGRP